MPTARSAPSVSAPDGPTAHALVEQLDTLPRTPQTRPSRSEAELSVAILLWPRFPMLSLAGLCDALRHAADRGDQSRQLRCLWTIVGVQAEAVEASCGIPVQVQSAFPDVAQFDYVVVIGGLLPHLDQVDRRYWDYLQRAAQAGIPLVGMLPAASCWRVPACWRTASPACTAFISTTTNACSRRCASSRMPTI